MRELSKILPGMRGRYLTVRMTARTALGREPAKLVPAPSGEDGAVENASGGPAEDPSEQAVLPPSHGGDAAGDPAETQKDEEAPTDPYLTDKAEGFQNRNIF